jgi:hypothetical protein
MKVELYKIAMAWVGTATFFIGIIINMIRVGNKRDAENRRKLWERLDEHTGEIQTVKETLRAQYYDKEETRKYVEMSLKPLTDKIDRSAEDIGEIKDMVRDLVSR